MNETQAVGMDFSDALKFIKENRKVARRGWNGKNMFLFLVAGDRFESGKIHGVYEYPHSPFIAMKTADDKVVPWLASQTDILANDYYTV